MTDGQTDNSASMDSVYTLWMEKAKKNLLK